jgi:hypothetical protein
VRLGPSPSQRRHAVGQRALAAPLCCAAALCGLQNSLFQHPALFSPASSSPSLPQNKNRWCKAELASPARFPLHLGRDTAGIPTPSHVLQPLTTPHEHLYSAASQSALTPRNCKAGPHTTGKQDGLDQTLHHQRQSPPPPPMPGASPPTMLVRARRRVVHGSHSHESHDNPKTKSSWRSAQLATDSWINGTSLLIWVYVLGLFERQEGHKVAHTVRL